MGSRSRTMLPKAMKTSPKAMTKTALAAALAGKHEVKRSVCSKLIGCFATIATKEVKKFGKFAIPNLCRIKTRTKPATKSGKRMMFGKEVVVKAKPAKTIVKAYPASKVKQNV